MPNLIPYVEYEPEEQRLYILVDNKVYLNITPVSYNFTPMKTGHWAVGRTEFFTNYGEWDENQKFTGFIFEPSSFTLIVHKGIVSTQVRLGRNFGKILDLLFGPSEFYENGEGALFCNFDPGLSEERLAEINGLIQALIQEDTD
jgi:hypothetical protein